MIECKNLTKIYKNGDAETVVLNNVSFVIADENSSLLWAPREAENQPLCI